MTHTQKVLLIGWDAADWKVIHPLIDAGRMPTLERLIHGGTMGNMATLFPSLSPMLWTTIATGKRPYKHGICGFTEPTPDGNAVQPMTTLSRRCKAIWNILGQQGKRCIVVGWWPSNPTEPINGVMVSDLFHKAPRRPGDRWNVPKHSVYSTSMLEELLQMRLHPEEVQPKHILPFVPHAAELDQDVDSRLASVVKVLCESVTIHRVGNHLLQSEPWDFAAIYYDAIDHYCHGFMKYHPPRQNHISEHDFRMFREVVTQGYIQHDYMLAQLLESAGDDTTVILISDHGFHPDHLRPTGLPTEPAGPAVEHRDLGIFVARGRGIKQDAVLFGASLTDITPTILTLIGLPTAEDMDGKPLTDIFEDSEVPFESIPSWDDVAGDDGRHPPDRQLTIEDSQQILEQLVALGYIERASGDQQAAVDQCQRELDYNLARSYMDGARHGDAIELLEKLYNRNPLEFRFGLQLANCLKAVGRFSDVELLVDDLNRRWKAASAIARDRLRGIAKLARERRDQWRELKKADDENARIGVPQPRLARVGPHGKPLLFSDAEKSLIRKIRGIARGNQGSLDYFIGTIAATRGDFERALRSLQKAELSNRSNSAFHFQVGNVYLGLSRVDDAWRSFQKAASIDQFHPGAQMGLCRCALDTNNCGAAIEFGERAIGLRYHFPLAHYFLAKAKLGDTDPTGAVKQLQTAIDQNPNFAEAHFLLAEIYEGPLADPVLASQHREAGARLQKDLAVVQAADSTLVLQSPDEIDYAKVVPDLADAQRIKRLPSLGQPRTANASSESPEKSGIVVVSGLPRSGTSMMMQMLVAGGLPAYADSVRQADGSNPKGYFESQAVKNLAFANDWLDSCVGKAIKVVAPLIGFLPQGFPYRVLFMHRPINDVLRSQRRMLDRLGRVGGDLSEEKFRDAFERQLAAARTCCGAHGIPWIDVSYPDTLQDPVAAASRIAAFVSEDLDEQAMAAAVGTTAGRTKS